MTPAEQLTAKQNGFDAARSNLYTTIGTTSDTISHDTIEALPQGTNATVEKVLLQAPGVSQDSAASGSLHVRNDHANVQFRINGVMLPDGVTGFGSVLDTDLIGSISLITGALPAEYGMRTAGLIDITTRTDIFNNSGSISYYGGSRGTIEPSFEYGGTFGAELPLEHGSAGNGEAGTASTCFGGVQYFFTGSYLQTTEGIENPLPTLNAIHDFSSAGKRLRLYVDFRRPLYAPEPDRGNRHQQFPNSQRPRRAAFYGHWRPGVRSRHFQFIEAQREPIRGHPIRRAGAAAIDQRLRRAIVLLHPLRRSALHAGSGWRPAPERHRFRHQPAILYQRRSGRRVVRDQSGAYGSRGLHRQRRTKLGRQYIVVEPTHQRAATSPPESITDDVDKLGWLAGVYAQDEWKITDKLTMNYGARFDQMWQYANANQLSPRVSFTYKPFANTTFHAGYARYFTPPVLVEAAPANIALFNGTTGAASTTAPTRCCRSARIISMPASTRKYRSAATLPRQKTAPRSISASMLITRSPQT